MLERKGDYLSGKKAERRALHAERRKNDARLEDHRTEEEGGREREDGK